MRIETEFIKSFCGSETERGTEEEDSLARATDVCTHGQSREINPQLANGRIEIATGNRNWT